MDQKNIIAALLFFLLFILWNMFGCHCLTKFRIKKAVNHIDLNAVRFMHERAHTIDYNRHNVDPAFRAYFRTCIAHRYNKEIIKPVTLTINIKQAISELAETESADPIRKHPHVSSIIE